MTIPAAARLMNTHHIRRLPVVDDKGRLLGIVSRCDLLSVFLRPDEDINADIRQVLDEILAEPGDAEVSVRNGLVTLTGTLAPRTGPLGDLIPLAIRQVRRPLTATARLPFPIHSKRARDASRPK